MPLTPQEVLEPLGLTSWEGPFSSGIVAQAAEALETGKLLYAPQLSFELSEAEHRFLTPDHLEDKSKNVSFRSNPGDLRGVRCQGSERDEYLGMLRRYHSRASQLLKALCPRYGDNLRPGFTSFRPAEIAGRATSWRHDDTRLHVDSFPSRPMQGWRILRVFSNVNPQMPRIWRVGEGFDRIAPRFLPGIRRPFPGSSWLLHRLRIVKGRRTEYDHFMLAIHDRMKADQDYQSQGIQVQLTIPPGATWACFTDWVPHAATSGQFAFEQTFELPVRAMKDPDRSPLRVLERLAGRTLA